MKKLIKRLFNKQPKHIAYAVMFYDGSKDIISSTPYRKIEDAESFKKKTLTLRTVRTAEIVTIFSNKPIVF